MEPPETPDYYEDLGLQQTATNQEIKRAHHTLAKKYHPDKQGLGVCVDAHDFRKIREAFECLRDASDRSKYDTDYPQLRESWTQYRIQRQNEVLRRAEEIARQQRAAEVESARRKEDERRVAGEKAAQEKRAAEAREARRRTEEDRLAKEKEKRERIRKLKEALAEKRSQETAQRAREQQEHAARERLRKQKEMEAERKSQEAASRARREHEVAAAERLKTILIEEKYNVIREDWARMREAAELRKARPAQPETRGLVECAHPRLGWPRRKGKANCVFCTGDCKKFSFICPFCDVTACQPCKVKYCIY